MERVQAPDQQVQAEVPSLAPFPPEAPTTDLEQLAATARSTPGSAGREALHALHDALSSLTPTEENGKRLLKLLDEGAFKELLTDDGSPSRELAVETLLRLGYPWALQIHPDELAWYRERAYLRKRNKWLILLGIFGLGAIAEAFLLQLF
jgi:hypothetical protein